MIHLQGIFAVVNLMGRFGQDLRGEKGNNCALKGVLVSLIKVNHVRLIYYTDLYNRKCNQIVNPICKVHHYKREMFVGIPYTTKLSV